MKILHVRNAHEALPRALKLLKQEGVQRDSRNGPVLLGPTVATIYSHPCEKVVFHPERDYNIFFTIYEALWILAGRNDIAPLTRYVSTFGQFSDDGMLQNAAYGHRLRVAFGCDQLAVIAKRLRANPDDRRCVAQIWDTRLDLDKAGVDTPCNDTITFQRNTSGALDMAIFCRSNDIVFGAYFANAFHFGVLLEYMAGWIGCPVGTYTQISVNWHGYLKTIESLKELRPDHLNYVDNPYLGPVHPVSLFDGHEGPEAIAAWDVGLHQLLSDADGGFMHVSRYSWPFLDMAQDVLMAHEWWRTLKGEERFKGIKLLNSGRFDRVDFVVAAREWLERRKAKS